MQAEEEEEEERGRLSHRAWHRAAQRRAQKKVPLRPTDIGESTGGFRARKPGELPLQRGSRALPGSESEAARHRAGALNP